MTAVAGPVTPALSPAERASLQRLGRLFRNAAESPRRRRLLFLALAAPGFAGVFATPLHRSLTLLVLGAGLFTAAILFRARTEPLFVRAESAALWPPLPKEIRRDENA